MSLARSLLQAWDKPLVILSNNANTLPHPARNSISNKIQELQEHSKSLGDGLDILSGKVGIKLERKALLLLKCCVSTDVSHCLCLLLLSRWVQMLRLSPFCPTMVALTWATTETLNYRSSTFYFLVSAATHTRLTAS